MEEYNRRKLVWKGNLQNKCQKIRFHLVCLSLACVQTSPPPLGKNRERGPVSRFFPEGGGDVCTQASLSHRGQVLGFGRAKKWNEGQKWLREEGEGEGKEGYACRRAMGFWKSSSPANGAPDWLGIIHICRSKVYFTLIGRDTQFSVVIVYSSRKDLPSDARAFSLTA